MSLYSSYCINVCCGLKEICKPPLVTGIKLDVLGLVSHYPGETDCRLELESSSTVSCLGLCL